ncbi:RNA-binding protein 33-like [Scylla paramamosain]|uniref:RNA-binding protein 33-like n=1 Tax=Scylla paramamosain TaxID=85552 RepID=UPI003082D337
MEHAPLPDDCDLDYHLLEPFIVVPNSCIDDISILPKLQELSDPAALWHTGTTPPPCHASLTHLPVLEPEVNLTSWDLSLLSQVSSDATCQALPSQPPQGPPHPQDAFHEAPILAPSHTLSQGLYGAQGFPQGAQGLPQGAQGLNQASQGLLQGSQPPWSLQQLSQALQDSSDVLQAPLEPRHEVPGSSLVPPSSQEVLRLPKAGVSGAGRAPASPARQRGFKRGRRASHSPREKLYQRKERFEDPVQEKKRIDAINSKKNRDRRAAELEELRLKVERYTQQRDNLLQEVQELRQRETDLLSQMTQMPASPAPPRASTPAHSPPAPTPGQPMAPFTPLTPPPIHPVTASPPPYHAQHITLPPPHLPCQALSRSPTRQ